jgi:hypothetical protein
MLSRQRLLRAIVSIALVMCLVATKGFYQPGTSVCILPDGSRSISIGECSKGEVHLIGQYVNLGVHNVASFGTESTFDAPYYTGQLGFIADFDRNGFNSSSPGYAGDFFVPGGPLEGQSPIFPKRVCLMRILTFPLTLN